MPLLYGVFSKQYDDKTKTKGSKIITYKLSKEEIEKQYGNIANKTIIYSNGYNNAVHQKLRRTKNKIGTSLSKEYWNVPIQRRYT